MTNFSYAATDFLLSEGFQEIQDELFSGDLALYDPRVTFGALLGLDGFSRQLTRVL